MAWPEGTAHTIAHMSATSLLGKKVLVVDDEPMVRQVLGSYLDMQGFAVAEAADGDTAIESITKGRPDLVLLDVMLPGVDGLTILSELRRHTAIPVILLTARADEVDRVLGLELGADDYVVKPFSPREVVARVRAVLKRSGNGQLPADRLDFGSLVIDGLSREVQLDGVEVELTPREFDLLAFLASSPRQVFTRGQLLEQVWDSSVDWQDPATVTVHIRRVRQKIETDPDRPRWLVTVWGVGYRFEP